MLATGVLPDLLKEESVTTTSCDDFYEVMHEVQHLVQPVLLHIA